MSILRFDGTPTGADPYGEAVEPTTAWDFDAPLLTHPGPLFSPERVRLGAISSTAERGVSLAMVLKPGEHSWRRTWLIAVGFT